METKLRPTAQVALILGIMALFSSAWNLFQVHTNLPQILAHESDIGYLIMAGYAVIVLFHLVSFTVILIHSIMVRRLGALTILLFSLGLVSFFAIGGEKTMFDEIAREIAVNGAAGEIRIVYGCLIVHIVYTVIMLMFLGRILGWAKKAAVSHAEREDNYFTIANSLGVVAGILGILITWSLLQQQVPVDRFWIYLSFYTMVLVPYGIAVAFWWSLKLHTRIESWYDEKQWRNILQSSFVTLILTVPGLALFFAAGKPTGYYWFPYHLSLTLFLFSAGTLYYYKQE